MNLLGDAIRIERAKQNISQAQLANKAGTLQFHISKIEKGKVFPKREMFYKILKALGITELGLLK